MTIPTLREFEHFGVQNRGVPNREAVVLRTQISTNLGLFGILCGRLATHDSFLPTGRYYPFEEVELPPNIWILVYSGEGAPRWTTIKEDGSAAYLTYLNSKHTLFAQEDMTGAVIYLGGIILPSEAQINDPR